VIFLPDDLSLDRRRVLYILCVHIVSRLLSQLKCTITETENTRQHAFHNDRLSRQRKIPAIQTNLKHSSRLGAGFWGVGLIVGMRFCQSIVGRQTCLDTETRRVGRHVDLKPSRIVQLR